MTLGTPTGVARLGNIVRYKCPRAPVAVEGAVARPLPAQIPACGRRYRTGLFRQPRFRNSPRLSPAGRLALLIRLCMPGQGFLCGLWLPVSPFPM